MTENRLVIKNDECVLENTETHTYEVITSKLLDKYILYMTDKLINTPQFWPRKVSIYQQELSLYRNYLYSYSDATIEMDCLEVSQLFYNIKKSLLSGSALSIDCKDGTKKYVEDELVRQICEDYISEWIMPEFLAYLGGGSLFLYFADSYGEMFKEVLIRNLQEYGIEVIEEAHETVNKMSIKYRENELVSVENFKSGIEFDIIADYSIVDGFELMCESEGEGRVVCFRFPFIRCNDVIHFTVDIVNERILISATNSRIGITVRKIAWG